MLEIRKEHGWCNIERLCDAYDVEQTNISLATFDAAKICPVDTGTIRQLLLRHANTFALSAYTKSKTFEITPAHERHVLGVMPIGLQPMSSFEETLAIETTDRDVVIRESCPRL